MSEVAICSLFLLLSILPLLNVFPLLTLCPFKLFPLSNLQFFIHFFFSDVIHAFVALYFHIRFVRSSQPFFLSTLTSSILIRSPPFYSFLSFSLPSFPPTYLPAYLHFFLPSFLSSFLLFFYCFLLPFILLLLRFLPFSLLCSLPPFTFPLNSCFSYPSNYISLISSYHCCSSPSHSSPTFPLLSCVTSHSCHTLLGH